MFLSNMRTASHFAHPAASPSGSTARLPPGPRGVPYFGSYFSVLTDRLGTMTDARDRFGDVAMLKFGPFQFLVLNDPEVIQHVLVKNHRNYVKSRSYAGLRLVMGNGLVTSEGDFWRRQRKLSQPAFHRGRLSALADKMAWCTRELADDWAQRGTPSLDLHDEMMRLTLRIVGHSLFSTELSEDAGDLGPAITTALRRANLEAEAAVRLPLWVPTPTNLRFLRARKLLDETIHRIISERRAHGRDMGDLLSMLMSVTGEDPEDKMTDAQLRDEVMTLFLAGHETIATSMSWTWMLLSEHPEVAQRVREEADAVLGGRAATFDDLPKLTYTERVIEEVMRLYPPVWIMERQALEEDEVRGFRIPKNAIVASCPWTLHRHPALWDNPTRFDPERFSPERRKDRHRYAYIPFGAGPRICIGNHFAMMEAKIITATLIQRFAIQTPGPDDIGFDAGVTLRPHPGMPAQIERLD